MKGVVWIFFRGFILAAICSVNSASKFSHFPTTFHANGCSPSSLGYIPHNWDCSKYYMCTHGTLYLMICPPGLHFDTEANICRDQNLVRCKHIVSKEDQFGIKQQQEIDKYTSGKIETFSVSSKDSTCELSNDGYERHTSNCSKYFMCSNGEAYVMECPDGLYFDSDLNVCNWSYQVSCKLEDENIAENTESSSTKITTPSTSTEAPTSTVEKTTTTESEEISCPSGVTSFCHSYSSDCTKFYDCMDGEVVVSSCESGFYFNPEGCYCDTLSISYCKKSAHLFNINY